MSVHNVCLVQELRLADSRFHTTPCAPKLVRFVYRLSSPFFLLFLLLWRRLATRLSLVSCQKALDVGRFFQKTFFNLKKNALSCRKRRRRWRFKKRSGLFWKHGLLRRITNVKQTPAASKKTPSVNIAQVCHFTGRHFDLKWQKLWKLKKAQMNHYILGMHRMFGNRNCE